MTNTATPPNLPTCEDNEDGDEDGGGARESARGRRRRAAVACVRRGGLGGSSSKTKGGGAEPVLLRAALGRAAAAEVGARVAGRARGGRGPGDPRAGGVGEGLRTSSLPRSGSSSRAFPSCWMSARVPAAIVGPLRRGGRGPGGFLAPRSSWTVGDGRGMEGEWKAAGAPILIALNGNQSSGSAEGAGLPQLGGFLLRRVTRRTARRWERSASTCGRLPGSRLWTVAGMGDGRGSGKRHGLGFSLH